MKYVSDKLDGVAKGRMDRIVMGKLKMDVDLIEGIQEIAKQEGVKTGVILSAIGALKKGIFRNPISFPPDFKMTDKHRLYDEQDKPMEIVSLIGWIATKENGEVEVHGHYSASMVQDGKTAVRGGHLGPGVLTSIKCVAIIGVIEDSNIKASLDPTINQVNVTF